MRKKCEKKCEKSAKKVQKSAKKVRNLGFSCKKEPRTVAARPFCTFFALFSHFFRLCSRETHYFSEKLALLGKMRKKFKKVQKQCEKRAKPRFQLQTPNPGGEAIYTLFTLYLHFICTLSILYLHLICTLFTHISHFCQLPLQIIFTFLTLFLHLFNTLPHTSFTLFSHI